ncbi:hypothetical protein HZS_7573 [Henneguya salminicola]|nr:hypothetical protein HZS_7573 [Henneguya salminicola]
MGHTMSSISGFTAKKIPYNTLKIDSPNNCKLCDYDDCGCAFVLDPRSPSNGITRTPIALSFRKLRNKLKYRKQKNYLLDQNIYINTENSGLECVMANENSLPVSTALSDLDFAEKIIMKNKKFSAAVVKEDSLKASPLNNKVSTFKRTPLSPINYEMDRFKILKKTNIYSSLLTKKRKNNLPYIDC